MSDTQEQTTLPGLGDEDIVFKQMATLTSAERNPLGILSMSEGGYPGMAGYCRRRRILAAYGLPKAIDETQRRIFARGYLTEKLVLNHILKPQYPRGRYNLEIPPAKTRWSQRGHPDYEWQGIVFEIKSIGVDARLDGPKPGHIAQLNSYLGYRQEITKKPKVGRIYYFREGREFRLVRYDIPFSVSLFDQVDLEAAHLWETYMGNQPWDEPGCFQRDVLTGYVQKLLTKKGGVPDVLRDLEFPCIWWTKQYRMRCTYFDYCWEKAEHGQRQFAKAEEGHIRLVGKYYEAQQAKLAAEREYKRLKGQVQTVGCLIGHQVGPFYVDKKGTVKMAYDPNQQEVKPDGNNAH